MTLDQIENYANKRGTGMELVEKVNEFKGALNYLFLFTRMNQIQGRIKEQCFLIIERLYLVLIKLKSINDISSCNITLKLMITILSHLINTSRLLYGKTFELDIKVTCPRYTDFLSQFINSTDKKEENVIKISNTTLDSLFIYFNFLNNRIAMIRKVEDISPENIFNYLISINNFEDAMVLVKCFPKLGKDMIFFLISEIYDISFAYNGKIIRGS